LPISAFEAYGRRDALVGVVPGLRSELALDTSVV
jgi:hypothetical protein